MKVIDALWFSSPRGTCGMVVGEDEKTGERSARVGVVYGLDEATDELDVLDLGTKISAEKLEAVAAILQAAQVKEPETEPPAKTPEAKPAKPAKGKKVKGK